MHIFLLGDSLFDNASYVDAGDSVFELLQRSLEGKKITFLAVDGHTSADVIRQLDSVTPDATHIFVSCGANDALRSGPFIEAPASSVSDALQVLHEIRERFRESYVAMLRRLLDKGCAVTLCTVHNKIPGMQPVYLVALALFNEVIIEEVARRGFPLIDLRILCESPQDYSSRNPIEPSRQGGEKIVRSIEQLLRDHCAESPDTVIYSATDLMREKHAAITLVS